MGLSKPAALNNKHQLDEFGCGNETLNEWLKKRALKNQGYSASRTFVICEQDKVVGYYALASGSVQREIAPKSMARNMPEPLPVIVLGRLAIDEKYQGRGLGKELLRDAILRSIFTAKNIGTSAILVHAISEDAKRFYEKNGFQVSPLEPMTLFMSMRKLKQLFET